MRTVSLKDLLSCPGRGYSSAMMNLNSEPRNVSLWMLTWTETVYLQWKFSQSLVWKKRKEKQS